MLRLGSRGRRGPSAGIWLELPTWRDVLLFATVAIMVAGSVAIAGLHLLKPSHAGPFEGPPNIMSERCSDLKVTEQQNSPEHHAAIDRASDP